MADNVNQQLSATAPFLREKILDNVQLANLFMGLVGKMVWESKMRSHPIEGIRIGEPQFVGMQMRVRVSWGVMLASVESYAVDNRFDKLADFVAAKARGLSRAMQRNPQFVKFFNSFVGGVEQLARHKNIPFDKMAISHAILTRDDCLVVDLADGRPGIQ